jgi:DNA-binding Xre family transcriptional regulator
MGRLRACGNAIVPQVAHRKRGEFVTLAGAHRRYLDARLLHRVLESTGRVRGCSMRDIARACGVSPSCISRLKDGKCPDADALLSLCAFLEVDAHVFAEKVKP